MKKFVLLLTTFIMLILIGGCTSTSLDANDKIVAPVNKMIPIEGKWEIYELMGGFGEVNDNTKGDFLNKSAQFSIDAVMLGDFFWGNPNYKVKNVKTDEYLVSRREAIADNLGIKEEYISVITVTSEDVYLCEFIKINEKEMIGFIQNDVYRIKKVSDSTDMSFSKKVSLGEEMNTKGYFNENDKGHKTGLLFGLRYPVKLKNGSTQYEYRTLWISAKDKVLAPILETKGIFFPRKSGFWRLESKRIVEKDKAEDILIAYNISKRKSDEGEFAFDGWENKNGSITRKICYVGNDYVSFESLGLGSYIDSREKWEEGRLQIQPVDNLITMKGVSIIDFFGKEGLSTMEAAKMGFLESIDGREIDYIKSFGEDKNFGLIRKNGHWYFIGRIFYKEGENKKFADYNLNIIPPTKLIYYDTLYLTWNEIKDSVPEAVDAFTSPNRDIAVITTKSKIQIYTISMGKLSKTPIKTIPLKDGEMVIMAEWARGDYVLNWEDNFIKDIIK